MSSTFVVHGQHFAGEGAVLVDQGVEGLAEHLLRLAGHAVEVEGRLRPGLAGQEDGALGDVDGQVADALQVAVDLQHGDDQAQVNGDGLVEGQRLEALLLQVHLGLVYLHVGLDDLLGKLRVPALQRPHGLAHGLLDDGASDEQPLVQPFQFSFEMLGHAWSSQPKRPVM